MSDIGKNIVEQPFIQSHYRKAVCSDRIFYVKYFSICKYQTKSTIIVNGTFMTFVGFCQAEAYINNSEKKKQTSRMRINLTSII